MKRKIFSIIVLLLSSLFLFYIFFFQIVFTKTIHLPLPILTVSEQFNKPENLKKWFTPFDNDSAVSIDTSSKKIISGKFQLHIQNQSMYRTLLIYSNGKKEKQFIISALPDTSKNSLTSLSFIYKSTYFKKWFGQGELTKNAIKSFNDFNEFIEDSKRVYGYEIKPVKVVDTLFLFERRNVLLSDKQSATKSIFENLIAYAAKNNLGYNGNRIFFSLKNDNNITLFASIGIAREISISENEKVEIKKMPFDKNLLEATYQGKYSESNKVFDALNKFVVDHNLSSMGIPYQKFISDGYDFSDDQIVQIKIYHPVL